jgi:hypothetical protein
MRAPSRPMTLGAYDFEIDTTAEASATLADMVIDAWQQRSSSSVLVRRS